MEEQLNSETVRTKVENIKFMTGQISIILFLKIWKMFQRDNQEKR
jgi:hypothetical protein